jgi:electron transfer flavoprotein beta subunit
LSRIIVLVKDIPDLNEIRTDPSTRRPLTELAKRRMNDLDKRALESAIRLKDTLGCEIITLSLGNEQTKSIILEALAMGADAAYLINDAEMKFIDALGTSLVLKSAINKIGSFDLIIAGELTLDGMGSQIGPRLAELLNIPQVTYVRELKFESGVFKATRDLEDFDEIIEAQPPLLFTVVREINEPRIPSLMNIMKAKKKSLTEWNIRSLGLSPEDLTTSTKIEILNIQVPEVKRKHIVIKAEKIEDTVKELVLTLRNEGILEA